MTDEQIKEVFEKYYNARFSNQIYSGEEFKKIAFEIWLAAERLAKIEVLEEVLDMLKKRAFIDSAREEVAKMIKELKAASDNAESH
jgi:hypothetical protein